MTQGDSLSDQSHSIARFVHTIDISLVLTNKIPALAELRVSVNDSLNPVHSSNNGTEGSKTAIDGVESPQPPLQIERFTGRAFLENRGVSRQKEAFKASSEY